MDDIPNEEWFEAVFLQMARRKAQVDRIFRVIPVGSRWFFEDSWKRLDRQTQDSIITRWIFLVEGAHGYPSCVPWTSVKQLFLDTQLVDPKMLFPPGWS